MFKKKLLVLVISFIGLLAVFGSVSVEAAPVGKESYNAEVKKKTAVYAKPGTKDFVYDIVTGKKLVLNKDNFKSIIVNDTVKDNNGKKWYQIKVTIKLDSRSSDFAIKDYYRYDYVLRTIIDYEDYLIYNGYVPASSILKDKYSSEINEYAGAIAAYCFECTPFDNTNASLNTAQKRDFVLSYIHLIQHLNGQTKENIDEISLKFFGKNNLFDDKYLNGFEKNESGYYNLMPDKERFPDYYSTYNINSLKTKGNKCTLKADVLIYSKTDQSYALENKVKLGEFTAVLKKTNDGYVVKSVVFKHNNLEGFTKLQLTAETGKTRVITDYCYCESDRFIAYFQPGVKVGEDFVVLLDRILDCIEEESGLNYINDSKFSTAADTTKYVDLRIIDFPVCPKLNPGNRKLELYCADIPNSASMKGYTIIGSDNIDPSADSDSAYFLVLALVDSLIRRNTDYFYSIMTDGLSMYITDKVLNRTDGIPSLDINSWYKDNIYEITTKNAEETFLNFFYNDDYYLGNAYGYNLNAYLVNKYGKDIIKKYIEGSRDISCYDSPVAYSDMAALLKKLTSKNLFSDFAGYWCREVPNMKT